MKILHILSGMGVKDGGTSSCTYAVLKGLRNNNINAEVLCYEPLENDKLIGNETFVKTVPYSNRNKILYSNNFKKALIACQNTSLYHINGLWQYPSIITAIVAREKKCPYIISPHGMLYPQALQKSKWLKKAVYHFFLKKDLKNAAVIHATSHEELQHIRNMGIDNPIAIIPNAIELKTLLEQPILSKNIIKFGYLGRVHPRKKIETLLYVWAKLGDMVKDAELVIIGSGDDVYLEFLQQETLRLHLKNVVFTGFLTGVAKDEKISSLSFLAVPSDFENFGMIVVEALALGIPVIASKGTPWQELESHNCGWWIANDVDTFYKFFEKALQLSDAERLAMAENGRKLIKEKYDSPIVAQKMAQLYNWVLNKGEKPDFVYE